MASVQAGEARKPDQRDGRGRVLAAAFDEAEHLPAQVEARERALEQLARGAPPHLVAGVSESDVGLVVAMVRAAGLLPGGGRIRSLSEAVESLGPGAVEAVVRSTPSYDLLEDGLSRLGMDRFRLHAAAVQRAADRIAEIAGEHDREELALAAVLHDIGRPVLSRLHPGYSERFDRRSASAEERMASERRELGIDHALVGGVLARRWGLHACIAEAIERHHAQGAEGLAAVIRTADAIAAHVEDCPIDLAALRRGAEACGLGPDGARRLLYELPQGGRSRPRASGPCPLSVRELDVLRRLAEGKVYKQIAVELDLSASTVRSHLHNVYGKLGALDRAQAVLMATDQGWI